MHFLTPTAGRAVGRGVARALGAACFAWAAGAAPAWSAECLTGRDGQTRCPPADSRCVLDRYGDVLCAPPGGGVLLDRYGEPVCGPGRCTKDLRGEAFCSRVGRGAASVDRYGDAVCTEGCQAARAAMCVRPSAGRADRP